MTYVPEAPEQRQLAIMHGNQFVGNLTKMFDFLTGRVSLIEIRHDGSANKRALVSIDLRRPDWMVYTPEKFSSSEAFRAAIEIRDAFNTFDYLLAHNTIWAETARHLWTLGPVVRGMQFLEKVFLLKGGLEFIKLRFPWLFLFSADHRDHSGANQATTQLSPVEVIQDFIAQREAEERSTRGAVPAYRSAFLDLGDARAQRVLGQPLLSYFYDDGTHPQLHQTSISERGRAESDAVVRGGDGGSARRELSLRPRDDDHSVVISGETGLSEGAQNDQGSLNLVWVFEQRISAISALPEVEDQLHALEDLEFVRGVLMTEPSPQGGLEANTRLLLEVGRLISEARRKAIAARSELRLASDLSQALRAKTVTEQTVRVQTELAQLRGLVHQLDQISSGWRDELGAWAEPFARQLGIRTPGHFNASGGFIVDQMNEALIQQALIEAPKGIPILFYLPPADAENSTAQRLRQRFQTEIADGRFIIPVLSPLETWTLEKFALREALKRGLDISDIYGIRTSEAVYQELGPTLVNRTLAGAVKLAEHRLLVVGGAKTIGQPLYTEFGWDDLLVAALSSVKSMAASA